ncbi:MAG: LytR/AlgR family response regulator transcription factor [Candidatus Cyclobacteriaceae bacterium M3_2C_046]
MTLKLIQQPHPFIYNTYSILLPGIITFFLILLVAPYGIQDLNLNYRIAFSAGLASIASLSVALVVGMARKLFPAWMKEEKWTLGKELLLLFSVDLLICFLIYLAFLMFDLSQQHPWHLFVQVLLKTFAISIFPISILVLFEQYNHLRANLRRSEQWNKQLSSFNKANRQRPDATKHTIKFAGENGKVVLNVNPDEVVCLRSEGNYVEVFYQDGKDHLKKLLIRNRLKVLSDQLPPNMFFQTHKSYLVNTSQITRVKGNARNYELVIRDLPFTVPVSRTKAGLLHEVLS